MVNLPGVELSGELGHGAYSIVYRGTRAGRACAVKLPRSKGAWTKWVYREAIALARVRDPGLPSVLEVGEADGLPFMAMELVEGETLADVLERGALPEAEALRIAEHLAKTLNAVHEAGLIHRDVKPRNIVISEGGNVRLIDFGFATPIERSGTDDSAGTPAYAAPEQLRIPVRIDGRADLFALGRVLMECLTGKLLPRATTGASLREGKAVSLGIAALLDGLLADAVDDRYPNARACASDIAEVRQGREPRGPSAYEATGQHGPLVGRSVEVDRFGDAWNNVQTHGSVFLVCGPHGAGKTRLLQAWRTTARSKNGARAIDVQCRRDDPPLAAVRRIISSYFTASARKGEHAKHALDAHVKEIVGDSLAPFARLLGEDMERLFGKAHDVDAPPDGFAEGATEILIRLVSRTGPTLLCVDDFEHIDAGSSAVFERLAHRLNETAIVLALALRPGSKHAPWFGALLRPPTMIELAPLTTPRVGTVVRHHLGASELPDGLAERVAALADGTPLGVLGVLDALLDLGALRPQDGGWILDHVRADTIALPEGSRALLGRRFEDLTEATRRVLEIAAILGTHFEDRVLALAVGLTVADVGFALAEARRSGVLATVDGLSHRFLHNTLRDLAAERLTPERTRQLHQQVADALDDGSTSSDQVFAVATHYVHGQIQANPARALRATRVAAEAALGRFDNESALGFFEFARVAALAAKTALDSAFHRGEGEAHLRLGDGAESLAAFERALAGAESATDRAAILGRIAWVHQTHSDPDSSWAALEKAFAALGARMPEESASSALDTIGAWAGSELRRRFSRGELAPEGRGRAEILCDLLYQSARLAQEYGRPFRIVQSTIASLALSRLLGPSVAQARARALHGLMLVIMGRREAATEAFLEGRGIAAALADPSAEAFCVQSEGVGRCFGGEFDEALELFRECLRRYGPWLEVNEHSLVAVTAAFLEGLRGRAKEASLLVDVAINRLRRSRLTNMGSSLYVLQAGRATSATMNRPIDGWVEERTRDADGATGLSRLFSWGPRARAMLEAGTLEDEFESLVAAFEGEGFKPSSAHPMLVEYYVSVAHARVLQGLARAKKDRTAAAASVRKALVDLKAAAKLPLFKAHAEVIEAYAHWFEGDTKAAQVALAKAEDLGRTESAPWVLSGAARLRALILHDQGNREAAIDQARIAETLARENGAAAQARRIRDDFGLLETAPNIAPATSLARSSSRRNAKQLSTLLQVVRAPSAEADPTGRARAVLDDLLKNLDAALGFLSFEHEGRPEVLVTRNRQGEASEMGTTSWRSALLRQVRVGGQAWGGSPTESTWNMAGEAPDALRVAAIPLFLFERPCGVVCLERQDTEPPFSREERELFMALSFQIPIALEVARLIAERERLHAGLQQVQKMEAVGQLAGGIAHDLNNMLSVFKMSLEFLETHPPAIADPQVKEEIEIMQGVVGNAVDMMKQLLSFSRNQPVALARHDANEMMRGMQGMLRRAARRVTWEFDFGTDVGAILIDKSALEQALVNLVVNAMHAMGTSGTITIRTRTLWLDESAVARGAPQVGEYVAIEVADSGSGMTPDTLKRIFDPFFTTKAPGVGTGLGLTMVYSFVKRCGGHVEVSSELNKGTTFSLQFPVNRHGSLAPQKQPPPAEVSFTKPKPQPQPKRQRTILVVDDDRRVREAVGRMLETGGYRVLLAESSAHALDLAHMRGNEISLAILDVLMPDIPGPELGQRLADLQLPAKLLFISASSPEKLGSPNFEEELLLKPFSANDLLGHVKRLLESKGESSIPPSTTS